MPTQSFPSPIAFSISLSSPPLWLSLSLDDRTSGSSFSPLGDSSRSPLDSRGVRREEEREVSQQKNRFAFLSPSSTSSQPRGEKKLKNAAPLPPPERRCPPVGPPRQRRRRHGSQQGHRPRDRGRFGRQWPRRRRRGALRGARQGGCRGDKGPCFSGDEGRCFLFAAGRSQRRVSVRFCQEAACCRARGR